MYGCCCDNKRHLQSARTRNSHKYSLIVILLCGFQASLFCNKNVTAMNGTRKRKNCEKFNCFGGGGRRHQPASLSRLRRHQATLSHAGCSRSKAGTEMRKQCANAALDPPRDLQFFFFGLLSTCAALRRGDSFYLVTITTPMDVDVLRMSEGTTTVVPGDSHQQSGCTGFGPAASRDQFIQPCCVAASAATFMWSSSPGGQASKFSEGVWLGVR